MPTVKGTRGNGENLRLNYLKDTAFYFKILFKLLGQTKVFIDFFFFLAKIIFSIIPSIHRRFILGRVQKIEKF